MKARTRSLADIRIVIGAVLTIIGLFLIICSAFLNGPDEMAKTGGVNANLWSGLGLTVIAALMILWWTASPAGESPSCPVAGVDVARAAEGASGAVEPPVACGGAGRSRPSRTRRLSSWV